MSMEVTMPISITDSQILVLPEHGLSPAFVRQSNDPALHYNGNHCLYVDAPPGVPCEAGGEASVFGEPILATQYIQIRGCQLTSQDIVNVLRMVTRGSLALSDWVSPHYERIRGQY